MATAFEAYLATITRNPTKTSISSTGRLQLLEYMSDSIQNNTRSVMRMGSIMPELLQEIMHQYDREKLGFEKTSATIADELDRLATRAEEQKECGCINLIDFTVEWACTTAGLAFLGALYTAKYEKYITMIYRTQESSSFAIVATFINPHDTKEWKTFSSYKENGMKSELVFHPSSTFVDPSDETKEKLLRMLTAEPYCFKMFPLKCLPEIVTSGQKRSAIVPR